MLSLTGNNVVNVVAYRKTLPIARSAQVAMLTAVGAAIGIGWLVGPRRADRGDRDRGVRRRARCGRTNLTRAVRVGAPVLALGSGSTSGFSGTSDPLNGTAIRALRLDYFVGARCTGVHGRRRDESRVFTDVELLDTSAYWLMAAALPIILVATFAGRSFNRSVGESGDTKLFWTVMGGRTCRLVVPVL